MALMRKMAGRTARSLFAAPLLLALVLAGCSSNLTGDSPVSLTKPIKEPETAAEREHQRILAAYGGAYENAKLQASLEQTVEKLVAASERPDLKYQLHLLNSPSVNAFALPSGNLYVTRGLIALANDNSEVASVLAHEMSHVIARHAAIREDQARQAALVNRVATDLLSDPNLGALALAVLMNSIYAEVMGRKLGMDAHGNASHKRAYKVPKSLLTFLELGFAIYYLGALVVAIYIRKWASVPFLWLFFSGFSYMSVLSLADVKLFRRLAMEEPKDAVENAETFVQ